ncbi:WD40 repeat domain-containing protein [Paenibacillus elgii]
MKNARSIVSAGAILFLVMVLSGCGLFGPKTETIIIPSEEEGQRVDKDFQPFQVKKIYRLPEEFTSAGQLLGWSGPRAVVASSRKISTPESMFLNRLTYPYEKSEWIPGIKADSPNIELSPDGKNLSEISTTASGTVLKMISLEDGKETEIAKFRFSEQVFPQDATWSNNSRYLCYLAIDPRERGNARISVYDIHNQTSKTYPLTGLAGGKTLIKINVSDDGQSVLLTTMQWGQSGRMNMIMMGTVKANAIEIQYEHQIGREQIAWVNNDQCVFSGTDGTLYVYDRRNGELSVLLEKVGEFDLSRDRKNIAYSLYNQDTIYAGKIQGKNVLFNEPVYHGLIPSQVFWSPDNNSLLIYGQKFYSPSQNTQPNATDGQSLIIEFQ